MTENDGIKEKSASLEQCIKIKNMVNTIASISRLSSFRILCFLMLLIRIQTQE